MQGDHVCNASANKGLLFLSIYRCLFILCSVRSSCDQFKYWMTAGLVMNAYIVLGIIVDYDTFILVLYNLQEKKLRDCPLVRTIRLTRSIK
jgi:hypothetical protein